MKNINVFMKSVAEVREDCRKCAEEISESYRPDIIIFIAKSGFLMAKPMAEYFHCEMADVTVKRPGDEKKDLIRKIFHYVPKFLLFAVLKSKFMYSFNDKHTERIFIPGMKFQRINLRDYKRILIVDDSADTGLSLLKAKQEIQRLAPDSEIKIFCYCVISLSEKRIDVDYFKYRDTIVISGTSRYSPEHEAFLDELERWKNENS